MSDKGRYGVRVQLLDTVEPFYTTENVIIPRSQFIDGTYPIEPWFFSLETAARLYQKLLLGALPAWKSIALVRICRTHPWPEIDVLQYKELAH